MAGENKELILNIAWCTGCGICAAFCPKKVLEVKHDKVVIANPEACIKCGLCELRCPDYALHIRGVEQ